MIISFSVENFRSIRQKICLDFRASSDKHLQKHLVVEIEKPKLKILKMAMIYGANASGKTNILLALDFLRQLIIAPKRDKNLPIGLPAFTLDRGQVSQFEIEFYYQGICYSYLLKLNNERILQENLDHYPKGYKANVFSRLYNDKQGRYEYKWTDRNYSKVLRETLQLAIPNQTILSAISAVEDKGSIQKTHDWFRFSLKPILRPEQSLNSFVLDNISDDSKLKDFYLPILQKADFQIGNIIFEEKDITLDEIPEPIRTKIFSNISTGDPKSKITQRKLGLQHHNEAGNFDLSFLDESMGTQRFFGLSIFLEMMTNNDICIPIDEIDCSLHLDLIEFYLQLFFKYSKYSQLIFSSHNVALLNKKHLFRRDCLWITDRRADGSTELSSVADYPVRNEHAIDKQFMKGQIGGKPDIGVI